MNSRADRDSAPPVRVCQRLVGARPDERGARFRVWAPEHRTAEVLVYEDDGSATRAAPRPLTAEESGWFSGRVEGVRAGARYRYRLDGRETYPDPASRSQPDGVHGPSQVVDPEAFPWTDQGWTSPPFEDWILYELHVGTATRQGTFAALVPHLDDFVRLGVNALELMPVAEFPGRWNWGYDGAYPYAPAATYGGPEGLRRLVDAAHGKGLAVVMDVVYNHLGPDGCYLPQVTGGRIFTERHRTPWGAAINFDDRSSDGVREFFMENALHWAREHHVDGLRLDAVHAIRDESDPPFLRELAERVRASCPRPFALIAEDERNDRRMVLPTRKGGLGLDAVWADDFHHQLRRLLAGDDEGYYRAYSGTVADLVETLRRGWFYQGQPYPPTGEPRGTPAADLPPERFVHCMQNHDQVGNRALGERIHHQIDLATYRAASALLLLSPYTPLLWMGQEWAASTPFLYFTDHAEELGRKVTEGRREEFADFAAFGEPALRERIPDPQSEETFERSKLRWEERGTEPHRGVLVLYEELLALRARAGLRRDRGSWSVAALSGGALALRRGGREMDVLVVVSFGPELEIRLDEHETTRSVAGGRVELTTEEARFGGNSGRVSLEPDGRLLFDVPAAVVLGRGA